MSIPYDIAEKIRQKLAGEGVDCQNHESTSRFLEKASERLGQGLDENDLAFLKNMVNIGEYGDVFEPDIAHTYFPNSDRYSVKQKVKNLTVESETFYATNNSRMGDFEITTPPDLSSYFVIEASVNLTAKRFSEDVEKGSSPEALMQAAADFCTRNKIPFMAERAVFEQSSNKSGEAARINGKQEFGRNAPGVGYDVTSFSTKPSEDPRGPGIIEIERMRLSEPFTKSGLRKDIKNQIKGYSPNLNSLGRDEIAEHYREGIFQKALGDRISSLCQNVLIEAAPVLDGGKSQNEKNQDFLRKVEQSQGIEKKDKFDRGSGPSI